MPPEHLVHHIERLMAREACVGNLSRWERIYQYWPQGGGRRGADETVVDISYKQAGVAGYKAGRRITHDEFELDGPQARYVFARYNIPTGRLSDVTCGWNCGPEVPLGGSCS